MKKSFTLLFALLLCATLFAQRPASRPNCSQQHNPPKIEEMVSDLSSMQKKRLENVMQDSRKQVEKLQKELGNVRKQIRTLIKKEGNHSEQLFPLFDREGALQAEIAKEKYKTRQQIDEILTKEQLKEFRTRCEADRQKHKANAPK